MLIDDYRAITARLRVYALSVGYSVTFSKGWCEGMIAGCDGIGLPLIQYTVGSKEFLDYGKGKYIPF
ncbi:MAG TPA: hypothetical protein DCL21_06630 [Alphaproteobacteria bacterium]|nr:hypothetical protein [Alphaproteobacteria bacterium]